MISGRAKAYEKGDDWPEYQFARMLPLAAATVIDAETSRETGIADLRR